MGSSPKKFQFCLNCRHFAAAGSGDIAPNSGAIEAFSRDFLRRREKHSTPPNCSLAVQFQTPTEITRYQNDSWHEWIHSNCASALRDLRNSASIWNNALALLAVFKELWWRQQLVGKFQFWFHHRHHFSCSVEDSILNVWVVLELGNDWTASPACAPHLPIRRLHLATNFNFYFQLMEIRFCLIHLFYYYYCDYQFETLGILRYFPSWVLAIFSLVQQFLVAFET